MKVTKAVIPAAGLGTRVLPATKAIPKEMLPIVDKPSIQYIVEEAVAAGITDILIITNRGKVAMEDHFDRSPELEERLLAGNKTALYNSVLETSKMANIYFIRQKETKGLGHAIGCARGFVGNEPFAVLYGDDVIAGGKKPAIGELCEAYEKYGKGVAGIKEVDRESIKKYCSLAVSPLEDRTFAISDMVEKPSDEQIMSLYAILGRCVLTPEIFEILDKTPPGAGGEIQLTDAMRVLAQRYGMVGYEFTGKRYDIGNKLGYLEAIVELGVKHPELGSDFSNYLKSFIKNLS
ncbi:MAG TPA: UTP--glucose-1-phosphate uridylyltransferase GalU [Oscillospiraceae bacterium]|nr:UTP--glucose-1-phosphate uridylyltransferase GalU [Oscillospiraceae bacterium]HPF56830.1 UTP--glucose-1-phosphate uridylyltransferase GalU [Clostridiales bacterium]HPK36405.1 UTP--glucose-1-phosphate uridylyltransferase GalU [Oscillospiraceae bacterium]HPR76529.1 UTP--glucose-1-phosphate uridylyltransferase GalU [Oscillospiraceae bacterium]